MDHIYFEGVILGFISFIIIGVFHPIVVKVEYYWGTKPWIWFTLIGIVCLILSLFLEDIYSILIAMWGIGFLWSVLELFHQKKRVALGRAKKNPKRDYSNY